jgi:PAS domain S-box-containing protein
VRDLLPSGALAIFSPEVDDDGLSLGVHDVAVAAAVMARPVVVGACDVELRITSVSSDVKVLLGRRPDGLIGMPFVDWVHPDDVAAVLLAVGRCLADGVSVGAAVRVQHADGEYLPMRLVVSPLHGRTGARFGFVLTSDRPEATKGGRAGELEQRLWRIALEVQAAGMLDELHSLPDPARLAQEYELSSRQWEVLARISRGERVPSIAKAMYVNQSTVRNHLSAIFRKFGVHSQTELLDHIRMQNQRSV